MAAPRKAKKPFGIAPSAMLKDLYFLAAAADNTRGVLGRSMMQVWDPIRKSSYPVLTTRNIQTEWAKLQRWLDTRKHLPGGRASGKVRPKADPQQLALFL